MVPPPGLLSVSDKELLSVFSFLSPDQPAGTVHPDAIPLSRTCRRFNSLYRLDYVTNYNCYARGFLPPRVSFDGEYCGYADEVDDEGYDIVEYPYDEDIVYALTRALTRLPRIYRLHIPCNYWDSLRRIPLFPQRITELILSGHDPLRYDDRHDSTDPCYRSENWNVLEVFMAEPEARALRTLLISASSITFDWSGFVDASLPPTSLEKLEKLHLNIGLGVSGETTAAMLACVPRLKLLSLTDFNFDQALVGGLPHSIEDLRLRNADAGPVSQKLSDSLLRAICVLPNLCRLDVSGSKHVTDWAALLPAAVRLESLSLSSCFFDKSSCVSTLSSMKHLTSLNLSNTCRSYDAVLLGASRLPLL